MVSRTMRYDCTGMKAALENRNSNVTSQEQIGSDILEQYDLDPWRQQPSKHFHPIFKQLGVCSIKQTYFLPMRPCKSLLFGI